MLIGEKLKEARLDQGLSLEAVQLRTKIQKRHLEAIERNDFSIIPGSFYARAYIKEYAQVVGIDPQLIISEHESELPARGEDQSRDLSQMRRTKPKKSSTEKSPLAMLLPTIFVILLVSIVGYIIWDNFTNGPPDESPDSVVENGQSPGDEVSLPPNDDSEPSDQDSDEEIEDETPEDQEEPEDESIETSIELLSYSNNESMYHLTTDESDLTLSLETSNRNWLEIEDESGRSIFQGMLETTNSPMTFDIADLEVVYLRFGEPGAISIQINDQPVELDDDIPSSNVQRLWIYINEAVEGVSE